MKSALDRKITPSGATFHAQYGPYDLGTYPSTAQAAAALRAAEIIIRQQHYGNSTRKAERELAKAYGDNATKTPGIRLRNQRFYVTSPSYLGGFDTLELALQARKAALKRPK